MTKKFPLTNNISRLWASVIVDEINKNNLHDFYAAPGMRNAPILSSIDSHPTSNVYSFLDERALGYRALGRSKYADNFPVLTCTSGTALANFLPAVIEAYRSGLPLIVLSADRPVELVKIDANQTIDQTTVLKDFTCFSLNLEAPSEALSANRLRALISNAIGKAKTYQRPVHINIPFREPLDQTSSPISSLYLEETLKTFQSKHSKTTVSFSNHFKADECIDSLIKEAKRPLLVIGKHQRMEQRSEYISTLKEISIPKYVDVTSGIKYNFSLADKLNPSFDHSEVFNAWQSNSPDLIIHIGGRLTSKHYYRFQEENPEINVIHITDIDADHDPGFSTNYKIICEPLSFLNHLHELNLNTSPPINWSEFSQRKVDIIENEEFSYPYISKTVVENMQDKSELLIANSTAIRSFDSYISLTQDHDLEVFSNRGVSGIEGFISTLCGMSDQNTKAKVLVIGDISFKYDLNALYMLNEINQNITLIIANNMGGGIFELLPISKEKESLHLLTTPHEDSFDELLASFKNINYQLVSTKEDFLNTFKDSTRSSGVNIIEAKIDSEKNLKVYEKLKTVKL